MTLLLFIWQFPQIVVGYIVKLLFAGRMQRNAERLFPPAPCMEKRGERAKKGAAF